MAKKKKKKSLAVQALERVGKNWSKASLTREALLQHVKGFARFVEKRYGLEQLENLKPGHVAAYVADMQQQNLSPGTMANRLSAVRQLAAAIGKTVPETADTTDNPERRSCTGAGESSRTGGGYQMPLNKKSDNCKNSYRIQW